MITGSPRRFSRQAITDQADRRDRVRPEQAEREHLAEPEQLAPGRDHQQHRRRRDDDDRPARRPVALVTDGHRRGQVAELADRLEHVVATDERDVGAHQQEARAGERHRDQQPAPAVGLRDRRQQRRVRADPARLRRLHRDQGEHRHRHHQADDHQHRHDVASPDAAARAARAPAGPATPGPRTPATPPRTRSPSPASGPTSSASGCSRARSSAAPAPATAPPPPARPAGERRQRHRQRQARQLAHADPVQRTSSRIAATDITGIS